MVTVDFRCRLCGELSGAECDDAKAAAVKSYGLDFFRPSVCNQCDGAGKEPRLTADEQETCKRLGGRKAELKQEALANLRDYAARLRYGSYERRHLAAKIAAIEAVSEQPESDDKPAGRRRKGRFGED
jgi:hypothetical protein